MFVAHFNIQHRWSVQIECGFPFQFVVVIMDVFYYMWVSCSINCYNGSFLLYVLMPFHFFFFSRVSRGTLKPALMLN
jgi:hypothetical protein